MALPPLEEVCPACLAGSHGACMEPHTQAQFAAENAVWADQHSGADGGASPSGYRCLCRVCHPTRLWAGCPRHDYSHDAARTRRGEIRLIRDKEGSVYLPERKFAVGADGQTAQLCVMADEPTQYATDLNGALVDVDELTRPELTDAVPVASVEVRELVGALECHCPDIRERLCPGCAGRGDVHVCRYDAG